MNQILYWIFIWFWIRTVSVSEWIGIITQSVFDSESESVFKCKWICIKLYLECASVLDSESEYGLNLCLFDSESGLNVKESLEVASWYFWPCSSPPPSVYQITAVRFISLLSVHPEAERIYFCSTLPARGSKGSWEKKAWKMSAVLHGLLKSPKSCRTAETSGEKPANNPKSVATVLHQAVLNQTLNQTQ